MNILEDLFVLALVVFAFLYGRYDSDRYNSQLVEELKYQIRIISAQHGVGYTAPPPPRRERIGRQFMQKLKQNGRAVQKISRRPT